MDTTTLDLVNRYYRAVNTADWAAYPDLFTEDATLEGPGGVTGIGVGAMVAFDQVWKTAAPDFAVTPMFQTADGSAVSSENLAHGTHTGPLATPAGEIPATGREIGGKYVGIFEIAGGRISAQRIYFDRMAIAEQLGMLPAPAER
jgi:ketosteroid isomerase-like protein